jgi:hypothetical protein
MKQKDQTIMNDLVVSVPGDGFDQARNGRVIQGELIKCVDGKWANMEGLQPPSTLMALATNSILQLWQNSKPIDVIVRKPGEALPNVDDLNREIPHNEWELGVDGKPRPPWQFQEIVYLLDTATAERFTFASGTIGARIAVEKLRDQVKWMRQLRGANVVPIVELSSTVMKTRFGQKFRPAFNVKSWVELGEHRGVAMLDGKSMPAGVTPIEPPSVREELDDEIPWV